MSKAKPLLSVPLLLLVVACGASDNGVSGEAGKDGAQKPVASISAERIRAHLEYLADDEREGRLTGEPGYLAAADYVAAQFEQYGLEPGGEDEGWFQQVPLQSYLIDSDSTSMIAHRDGEDRQLVYRDDYSMGGDPVRSETGVRAEVVYAGYGVHAPEFGYSDYEDVDVEGKIIAIFGRAPAVLSHNERAYYSSSRTKYQEAVKRGAVGIISLRTRYNEEMFPWERVKEMTGKKPGMSWVTLSDTPEGYHPEIKGAVYLSAAAAAELFAGTPISFEEALDAAEEGKVASVPLGVEVTLSRRTQHERISSPNVIGIVRGSDPELASEYIVYSGHLDGLGRGEAVDGDDIYNGAYDNAIGVSLLLESARIMAASPPKRSVIFIAVTGEEKGLLGSDYFAHYPTVPIESIVANVNLDMTLFLFPVADVIAFGAEHSSLEPIVQEALAAEGFELTPDPMPQEVVFIRSDQYSFVRQGVPATFLVTGYKSTDASIDGEAAVINFRKQHYHRPSDDLSLPIDWDSAVRFARANTSIGYKLGNATTRPSWNEGDFFGEKFAKARMRQVAEPQPE
ncbi:MAG TPA: M28 family metallopeptidase [Woeseiaceae bacterium]|nr:M28 family metallopeptidase [Woeseiaceae bacterium]